MDDRRALLAAVAEATADSKGCDNKYQKFLVYVKRHSSRSDDLNLSEVLQPMGKKDHQKLWAGLLEIVSPITEEGKFLLNSNSKKDESGEIRSWEGSDALPTAAADPPPQDGLANDTSGTPKRLAQPKRESPQRRTRRGEEGEEGGCDSGGDKTRKEADVSLALEVLHAAAVLAQEFLSDKRRVAPRALLETAACLHGIILSLQGLQGTALQGAIAKVCEMWWLQERLGGEHLVTHLLPLMLVRSLDEDAKEADVKRVFGMRTALLLLDFDDESSESLRALLLRAFISPLYLKSSEGRRLLAYLFGLHQSLVLDIHAVIRAQIPGAKRAVLAAYGEIYFRVWRGADGPYLEKVEMHCLQDLMHACIHASTPKMHASLLVVLDGVHSHKKVKGMDAALLRLYGPVLWRALRVANPTVRAQACQVLVDAFPLQDPSAGAAAYEAMLRQQFDALAALLEDGQPRVRAVSAKGVCQILSVYWEMIPMPTTRSLLATVVGRLASDGASPMVRLGAVEGLMLLLDCPASHGVLKTMLPGVSKLIHDTNKKVRVAFVKLLGLLKSMRSIKYYHVVPVDHILARLAEDHVRCPASASALTKLISNSYFPTGPGVTGALQISRCLTLLSQDEGAATAFFSRLHEIAGVPSAAKILAMLVRCAVIAAVNSDEGGGETPLQEAAEGELDEKKGGRGKRKGFEGEGGKGKDKGEKRTLKASDSKSMSGVLNLIGTIWERILPALEETVNEPSLELIQRTITAEALGALHKRFFRDDGCRSAFMRVAGLAGIDLAPGMLEEVVLEMLDLPADATPPMFGPTVELICSWGQEDHLLGAIVSSLEKSFSKPAAKDRGVDDAVPDTFASRGKRRRPVRGDRGGGDRKSGGNDDTGLPPALALSMLNHLLAGGNGHAPTAAARDSIIADDVMTCTLESTLSLAREMVDARLSGVSSPVTVRSPGATTASNHVVHSDALLVRAVEALGRIFMHREAALVGDVHGRRASREGHDQPKVAQEDEDAILRPMPFSVKMRELMVWTTNTVLPVLAGLPRDNADGMDLAAAATPVKPAAGPGAGASAIAIGSPSPLPPPRSKPRGEEGVALVSARTPSVAAISSSAGAVDSTIEELAEGILATVILLASEWVEVGSGLAEISMRADTWGDRLLDLLLHQDEACCRKVVAVLPQLCRLGLQLLGRESQGARPSAAMWEVLLRCADCRVLEEGEDEEYGGQGSRSPTHVQRYLVAALSLQSRLGDQYPVLERLLGFVFTQASAVVAGDDSDDEGDGGEDGSGRQEHVRENKAPKVPGSINDLARLQVRPNGGACDGVTPGDNAFSLELSRPAAAVLGAILRSAPASKAAGSLVLAHLGAFRPGDAGSGEDDDAAWPLFCAHVLGALIEHAPAKARLEIAADAHSALKGAATAANANSASMTAFATDVIEKENASEGIDRASLGIDTRGAAAFAVCAIYDRLEAARQAANTTTTNATVTSMTAGEGGGTTGSVVNEAVYAAAAGEAVSVEVSVSA